MLLILRFPFGVVLLGLLAGSVAIPISPAAPCLSNPGAASAVNSSQKRALLIGVGVHPRDTGYARLPGVAADMRLMQNVLAKQGFEDIRVIRDQEADLAGLQVAFETLIEQSGVDDVVVVHYSGHGDRLPDDDPDNPDDLELDGFDEVLVPYGAPSARRVREMPDGAYQGEKHLRDDALHAYLDRLRRKVGPGGHVLVVLDACNSGSGTRGEVVFRGGDGPIGSNLGDGVEEPQEMDALGEDEALAPYVALFATRYDQKAVEVNAGLLTLALVAALESVPPGTSYQALFEKITARIQRHPKTRQTPQIEGHVHTAVFNGATIEQQPYFVVNKIEEGRVLELEGGTILGLHEGAEVAIHPWGTANPIGSTPLATGTVASSSALRARVALDEAPVLPADSLQGAWAFVTRQAFDLMQVRVHVEDVATSPVLASVAEALAQDSTGFILPSDETSPPDLVVAAQEDSVVLRTATAGPDPGDVILGPLSAQQADLIRRLLRRITSYARNQYMRTLSVRQDPYTQFSMMLTPARIEDDACQTPAEHGQRVGNNFWEMTPGDAFLLTIRNEGRLAAFFTLLDLKPDGTIEQLFPLDGEEASDSRLSRRASHELCLRVTAENPTYGLETLKLFATATSRPLDFRPILGGDGLHDLAGKGNLQPFEQLFLGTYIRTKSPPVDHVATASVTIRVVRPDP